MTLLDALTATLAVLAGAALAAACSIGGRAMHPHERRVVR